jgi:hypothetical protein
LQRARRDAARRHGAPHTSSGTLPKSSMNAACIEAIAREITPFYAGAP